MILRPYRKIRELQQEIATLYRVRDALYRVMFDERRTDLRDAIVLMQQMHERNAQMAEQLDGYDEALRLLSEQSWQRKLEVGQ